MWLDNKFDYANEGMDSDHSQKKRKKEKDGSLRSNPPSVTESTKNVVKTFLSSKNPGFVRRSRKYNETLKKNEGYSKCEEDEIVDSEGFSDEIVNSSQDSANKTKLQTSKKISTLQKKTPMILQLFELSSQNPVTADTVDEAFTDTQPQNADPSQTGRPRKKRGRSMLNGEASSVSLNNTDLKINATLKTDDSKFAKNRKFSVKDETKTSCLENRTNSNNNESCEDRQIDETEQAVLNGKTNSSLRNSSKLLNDSEPEDKKVTRTSKSPKIKPRLVTLPPRKGPFLEMWPEDKVPRSTENQSSADAEIRFMISCGQRPAVLSNVPRCPERPFKKAPFLASEDFAMLVWMARVYPIEPRRRSTKVWKWAEQHELTSRPWDSMRSRVRLLTDYLENRKPLPDDLLKLVKKSPLFTVSGNVITSVVSEEVERQNSAGEQNFIETVDCSKFLKAEARRAAIRCQKKAHG